VERTREDGQSTDGIVPSLAPLEFSSQLAPAVDLEALCRDVRAQTGELGREAHERLHQALEKLAPESGATLVKLLDDHAFDGMRTADGTDTRRLAVETLLRLGYPWALQIQPEELEWLRAEQRAARVRLIAFFVGLTAIVGGTAAYLFNLWG